jgi:hypothetical protein
MISNKMIFRIKRKAHKKLAKAQTSAASHFPERLRVKSDPENADILLFNADRTKSARWSWCARI